jgi:riboflavin synthase
MFTGLIEELGEIVHREPSGDGERFTIRGSKIVSDAKHGDSIAVSGVCLTVIEQTTDTFTADVMAQTLAMSTMRDAAPGLTVNLERAAKAGDRLGGHIVQGHVDGTAVVTEVRPGDEWRVVRFALTPELAPLVVNKGSICVDGI